MDLKVQLIDDGLGVTIFGKGYIAAEEYFVPIMEHLSRPDEELKKIIYTIADYSSVTKAEINMSYIRKIAQKCISVAKINPNVVLVNIATNDVVYGLIKMFSALAKLTGWSMNVFREKEEAYDWLKRKIIEKHGDIEIKFK